jgi:signal transduction histidine kinase
MSADEHNMRHAVRPVDTNTLTILNGLSHELKNSLISINGFARLLYDDLYASIGEVPREYLTIILQSNQRLLHILNDVVTLIGLESGEIAREMETIPAAGELKRIIANLLLCIEVKNLRLITLIDDKGALLSMDRHFLEQIVTNLLTNAVKFTPRGCITIALETKDSFVELTVSDTGIGISDAFKSSVFKPFSQEEIGFLPEYEGAGLGLAITKRLTELMGGTISFESEKSGGSTFTVRFPISGVEKKTVAFDRERL